MESVRTHQTVDCRNCLPLAATASMCGANEANSARPRAWVRLLQPSPRHMSWGQALDTNLSQVLHPLDGAQLEGSKMDVLHIQTPILSLLRFYFYSATGWVLG